MPRRPQKPPKPPAFDQSDPPRHPPADDVDLLALAATPEGPDPVQLNQIIDWMTRGWPELEIRQAIAREMAGLDVQGALVAALQQIAKSADADPTLVFAWSFEAGRSLYRRMVDAGDYAEALKALKFVNDTARLLADPKFRRDVPDTPPTADPSA